MALSAKREAFVQLVFQGQLSLTEAWRQAGFGATAKDTTAHKRASELLQAPEIQARLSELREGVAHASYCTLNQHLSTLAHIRDLALLDKQYAAAGAAEKARGQAIGHYIKRVAVETPPDASKPDYSKLSETELVVMMELLRKAGASDAALH